MTTAELIAVNIITNNTFAITAAKVREVLLQMNNEIIAAAAGMSYTQEFEVSFPNTAFFDEEITHTLNTKFLTVDIWLPSGEKIPYESYSVFGEDTTTLRITKLVVGVWSESIVVLTKKA